MMSNKFSTFCNSYFKTNLFAIIIFTLISILAVLIDFFVNKNKKITTKKITISASFISIIVLINTVTIWISKAFLPPTYEFRLGDAFELLPGMILGPTMGIICAICADTLTIFTTANTGVYHFGFALEAALTGFIGSIVFLLPKNKLWVIWTILLYSIIFILEEFILTPIFLSSLYPGFLNHSILMGVVAIPILISTIIKLPIYLVIFIPVFVISYNYTNRFFEGNIWPNWNGELEIWQKNKTKKNFTKINKNRII